MLGKLVDCKFESVIAKLLPQVMGAVISLTSREVGAWSGSGRRLYVVMSRNMLSPPIETVPPGVVA